MNKLMMVGLLNTKAKECCRRVYDENGIAPTINTMQGGQREPKVLIRINSSECQENDLKSEKIPKMKNGSTKPFMR